MVSEVKLDAVDVPATARAAAPQHVGFLTLANYTQIAFCNAVEPLRMANQLARRTLYEWSVVTLDGRPALASNRMSVVPTSALAAVPRLDVLFVCGGLVVHEAVDDAVVKALRQAARSGVALGGICTGTYALARAGLVDGYRCSIHWENLAATREEFPQVTLSPELFVIDRDRYTCSGGIAPIDMMLQLIGDRHGKLLATAISEQFIISRLRDSNDAQRVPVRMQAGGRNETLLEVAAMMENNLEDPLSLDTLARAAGVSRRQVERLFERHLGCTPSRYYLELRLRRARELLLLTNLSVIEITVACGFQSSPHFSKCYRRMFGHPPTEERRLVRWGVHSVA